MASVSTRSIESSVTDHLNRWLAVSLRFALRRPLGAIGAVIVIIMILAAALAGFIAPFDPLATDYAAMLQAPSAAHWFGTDSFGRDVLSRIIYGSRTALWVGFGSSFFRATPGSTVGLSSAVFHCKVGPILARSAD